MTDTDDSAASTPAPALFELDRLEVRFGKRVILNALTAALHGRSIGLLGPNGAGKTTLLHTLLGFHPASGGGARLLGLDVCTQTARIRACTGYMPENDAFVARMSAVRLTTMLGELAGLSPQGALERAHEALTWAGLGEARYRPIGTYSLGMRQMTKLAQAVVAGPKLLILDEPTNGMDPPVRARMIDLIKEVRDSGATRIILSSHLLKDVEDCCDEVLILKDGEVASTCNIEAERRTNRKFLELEVEGDSGPLEALARERGCECAVAAGGRIKMILPQGVEIADLYAVAARCDLQIRRLSSKRDSLQEIFLKAMEGSNGRLPA
ncbi:MAG TPA: ABC transporter ATP-binding protein [Thermoanaerobaculaceae bacterium]|nr:ABC transporter ATP-binding protein [Thermoanaerobaculaceae bacterium]HPS76612.1 ABC transporter ATP-binding protein [Thermoanaerobaculaceae bacterium]